MQKCFSIEFWVSTVLSVVFDEKCECESCIGKMYLFHGGHRKKASSLICRDENEKIFF